jgi:hypothetical protein
MEKLKSKSPAPAATLKGKTLAWSALPPKSVLLMVQTSGTGTAKPSTARLAGTKRPVIIDGVLMELDEEFIVGQVRAGAFTIVYPGTNIPWDRNGPNVPHYPPDWYPPI